MYCNKVNALGKIKKLKQKKKEINIKISQYELMVKHISFSSLWAFAFDKKKKLLISLVEQNTIMRELLSNYFCVCAWINL